MGKIIGEGITFDDVPVSYTHLDVYKRQVMNSVGLLKIKRKMKNKSNFIELFRIV